MSATQTRSSTEKSVLSLDAPEALRLARVYAYLLRCAQRHRDATTVTENDTRPAESLASDDISDPPEQGGKAL